MTKYFTKTKTYKEIVRCKIPCYFVSPHFDDAIFSAGALIWSLIENKIPTTVINVFTRPSSKPYTFSGKKFLNSCGYTNADCLYRDRKSEDKNVMSKIGVEVYNLGFVDALWRRKNLFGILKTLSNFLPEIGYIYPFFSLNIKIGRVSEFDGRLKVDIANKLAQIVKTKKNYIIFCPISVGKHIDHTITRDVCRSVSKKIIYWQDYPYSDIGEVDKEFYRENNLKRYFFKNVGGTKDSLVNSYKTQIRAVFGKDETSMLPDELYFMSYE